MKANACSDVMLVFHIQPNSLKSSIADILSYELVSQNMLFRNHFALILVIGPTLPQFGMGVRGYQSFALAHNARSKEEVDLICSRLKDNGAMIVKEPEEVFWGGYSGYFSDPDGHSSRLTRSATTRHLANC